jgi:hypothetical protein
MDGKSSITRRARPSCRRVCEADETLIIQSRPISRIYKKWCLTDYERSKKEGVRSRAKPRKVIRREGGGRRGSLVCGMDSRTKQRGWALDKRHSLVRQIIGLLGLIPACDWIDTAHTPELERSHFINLYELVSKLNDKSQVYFAAPTRVGYNKV